MHESRRSAAARGGTWWQPSALISSRSLQSSCPRYSDLHRGLSPRLSIYPIHPAIQPSIHPPVQSIDQSASLSLTHSIHPSIHPLLPASRCFRSVEPARNQSIDPSVPINHPHVSNPIHPAIHPSIQPSIQQSIHPSVLINQSTASLSLTHSLNLSTTACVTLLP